MATVQLRAVGDRGERGTGSVSLLYDAFGLHIASDVALPECALAKGKEGVCGNPDIIVQRGHVPGCLGNATSTSTYMDTAPDRCLLRVPQTARFLMEEGRRITVDIDPSAEDFAVRAYLLGTGLGTVLHQRKHLPLHMSAVATPTGIVGFAGPSGGGKSTIAAAVHLAESWPILTDDLAVVQFDGSLPRLLTGVQRLRLWSDAISTLDLEKRPRTKVVSRAEKYQLDLVGPAPDGIFPFVKAMVLLERGDAIGLEKLRGAAAFSALWGAIYRPDLGARFNDTETVFSQLSRIANSVEVFKLKRPFTSGSIHQSAAYVAERLS